MFFIYDKDVRAINVDKIVELYIESGTKHYSEVYFVEASLVNGETTIFDEFKNINEAKDYLKYLIKKINNMLAEERIKTIVKEIPMDEDILD